MKSNFIQETSVAAILVVLLAIILNPFHIWMPDMMHVLMLVAVVVVFAIFASFILREKVADERDAAHRSLAGRIGFLAGSAALVVGIFVQALSHHTVDEWLIITLVIMIIAKIGTRMYTDRNY